MFVFVCALDSVLPTGYTGCDGRSARGLKRCPSILCFRITNFIVKYGSTLIMYSTFVL